MLTWTLAALVVASASPMPAAAPLSFEQPPASTVLQLVDAGGRPRPIRLNLPAIIETLRLESKRGLSLAARAQIPATVELGAERKIARVSLGAARGQAAEKGQVRLSRSLRVEADGLSLDLVMDIVLAPEPSALGAGELEVQRSAIVAVSKASGRYGELELVRHAFFAHPTVPMRWTAPASIAKWKAESREGWLVLGAGLYPEVFVDGAEVSVLFDAGDGATEWRLQVQAGRAGVWTDGERVIEWTKETDRWVGRVRGFGAAASLRLGDASSPMSVDFGSSSLPAGERAGL